MERYADEREANQNLRQRIEMLQEENTRLKAVEHNFGRVWSYYGAEQVKRVVELMAGRERAAQNVQRQKREHKTIGHHAFGCGGLIQFQKWCCNRSSFRI